MVTDVLRVLGMKIIIMIFFFSSYLHCDLFVNDHAPRVHRADVISAGEPESEFFFDRTAKIFVKTAKIFVKTAKLNC